MLDSKCLDFMNAILQSYRMGQSLLLRESSDSQIEMFACFSNASRSGFNQFSPLLAWQIRLMNESISYMGDTIKADSVVPKW